ncbi:ABC transporter ATP-binding protein [uncultured Methanolobus sp.]|uniref:ABC transporter ATP-binding protein n=1 Tax=uncultured Methanolobus sp. TaxID=218300 RepID=UPI002AABB694|nr:ABC transporter ATP-binding protein [uncultured Methanolobus sp.]
MTLMSVDELNVVFHGEDIVKAVNNVSFSIDKGEILALVGETGCGKSVVAHAIMRLLPSEAVVKGNIAFEEHHNLLILDEGTMCSFRGNRISVIFQNPSLSLNPVQKSGIQIAEPLRIHRGIKKETALEKAASLLKKIGFSDTEEIMDLYPGQCSGGMNQRYLIAAGAITEPSLIIADEPTKGLDADLVSHVENNLLSISKQKGISMLLITHDLSVARNIADRIAVMYAGEIVEIAEVDTFFERPLHPYSRGLLQSLPENGFVPIPGDSVNSGKIKGCYFSSRCTEKMSGCLEEHPPLYTTQNRQVRCFKEC